MTRSSLPITAVVFLFALQLAGPQQCPAQFGGAAKLNRISEGGITILFSNDRAQAWGYSKFTGKWNEFNFPKETVAVAVVGRDVAAFQIRGDQVPVLVVFSGIIGAWSSFPLAMRDQPKFANPLIAENVVCFQLDGKVIAYSPKLNKWAALSTTATPVLDNDTVICETDEQISIFSAHTGTWATATATE